MFVAVGEGGRRAISSDGIDWSNDIDDAQPVGDNSWQFRGVTVANGMIVAVGGGTDTNGSGYTGRIVWSSDSVTWGEYRDSSGFFGDVAYGNGVFVAVGSSGRYAVSSDGMTWSTQDTIGADFDAHLRSIAFGNGTFVATGNKNRRVKSSNGTNWTDDTLDSLLPPAPTSESYSRVTFGGGVFATIGTAGQRIRSVDGANWTNGSNDGIDLSGLAFGNGMFVALGSARAEISTDAIAWTTQQLGVQIDHATYGNAIFVGYRSGDVLTSIALETWEVQATTNSAGFKDIAYGVLQ